MCTTPEKEQEITCTGIKFIGSGSFGKVYEAKLQETNQTVAIKMVKIDNPLSLRELQILRRLEHINIIKLQYFFYSPGYKVKLIHLCFPH